MGPLLVILLSLLVLPPVSDAALAAWQPSVGADGYRLHQGLVSGTYDTVLEVGEATQAILSGLQVGQTYYVVVTAYNGAGESDYSAEVAYTAPVTPLPLVLWVSPVDGATVPRKGLVTLEATAAAADGVTHVALWVNGQVFCRVDLPPYRCVWRVPAPPRRTYTLHATATTTLGTSGSSAPIRVTAQEGA